MGQLIQIIAVLGLVASNLAQTYVILRLMKPQKSVASPDSKPERKPTFRAGGAPFGTPPPKEVKR